MRRRASWWRRGQRRDGAGYGRRRRPDRHGNRRQRRHRRHTQRQRRHGGSADRGGATRRHRRRRGTRRLRRNDGAAAPAAGPELDAAGLEPGQLVRRHAQRDQLGQPHAQSDPDQGGARGGVQHAQNSRDLDESHRRGAGVHDRRGVDGQGDADRAVGRRRGHVRLREHAPRCRRPVDHVPRDRLRRRGRGGRGQGGVDADRHGLQIVRQPT